MLDLSREVTSTLNLQTVLDKSLAALRRIIDFDGGSIQLIVDGALQLVAADPAAPPEVYAFRLPLGEGFGGRVAMTGDPIYSPDATVDPRAHKEGRAKASTAGVRSYFAAPLIEHGRPIGIVQLDSRRADAFGAQAQERVLAFVPTIAAAVQNARLFNREVAALNELRAAERMKDDFIAIVSHELRTPLTTLLGFAETLATHATTLDPGLVESFGQRMARAARMLMHQIEDIISVSAIERGGLRADLSAADVGELIASWREELSAPSHVFAFDIAPDLPQANIDADRLRQVLECLLSNARKFSPSGSRIVVAVEQRDGRVAVHVHDQGRGFSAELLGRIFDRFVQGESPATRSTGGLGIGLYLAKHLCALMGAELTVSSEPERGSTFTVLLQAAPAQAPPVAPVATAVGKISPVA